MLPCIQRNNVQKADAVELVEKLYWVFCAQIALCKLYQKEILITRQQHHWNVSSARKGAENFSD